MHGRTDRRTDAARVLAGAGIAAAIADPLTTWWSVRGGAVESNQLALGLMRSWGLVPVLLVAALWQVGVVAVFCWAIRLGATIPDPQRRAIVLWIAVVGFALVVASHWAVIVSNVRVGAV